jgi:cytoskeletal protein CcmA (bactofilin family)
VRGPVLAPDLEREAATEAGLDRVLVLAAPATLAGNLSFPRELYATADFSGGERNMYRAVLGDARVALGPASAVLRWAHAAGDLVAGDGVTLSGRASSDRAIRLGSLVRFDRLAAPVILVGEVASGPATASTAATPYTPPPDRSRQIGDHLRVEGDLTIPPGASLDDNLVVAGDVTLGAGARLGGSLKAHGAVVLGAGAEIAGAVVSRTTVRTGAAAIVGGPVVAEESVELGSATRVGDPAHPTSIASPHVLLGLGVQVCGLITATEGGTTA